MHNKSLKSLVLTLVALNCVALALYVFMLSRIDALRTKTEDTLVEHATVKRQQERVAEIQHLASEIEPLADKLRGTAIEADGVVRFIEILESTARSIPVELQIQSVEVSGADVESGFEFAFVDLSAKGTFNEVERMIESLENMPIALSIGRVRLERVSVEAQEEWRASLLVRALKKK